MGAIVIDLDNNNYKRFLKKLSYYKYSKSMFEFNYSRDFKYKDEAEMIEHTLNLKNKKDRYSYIYDVVCDYLDNLFINNNMCEFSEDKCFSNRCKKFNKTCGCCSNNKGEECPYFDKDHCTIKCSGCKFYICPNLKKKKGPIRMKDVPLVNYFFNTRQKLVLRYTVFTPKEEIIDKLIKFKL